MALEFAKGLFLHYSKFETTYSPLELGLVVWNWTRWIKLKVVEASI